MVSGSGFHFPWNSASRRATPTLLPEGESPGASAAVAGDASHSAARCCNFLSALLARFIFWITGKFGETMTSEDVNRYLDVVFPEDNWERKRVSITTVADGSEALPWAVNGYERSLIWREREVEGEKQIVTDTCHDMPADTPILESIQATALSVAECLFHVCQNNPQGKINVQIPVEQSSPFFGGYRGHFVLLNVSVENGRVIRASVIESKQKHCDFGYDGAHHLFVQLRDYPDFPFGSRDDFEITTHYLGDQPMTNGNDCGRYAVAHARRFVSEKSAEYAPMKVDDFLSWCALVQAEADNLAAKEKARPLQPLDAKK